MADFGKVILRAVYSVNSDYSDPRVDTQSLEHTMTPDTYRHIVLNCATAGTTIELGEITTIEGILIKNLDATNFAELRWTSQATANKQKLAAGKCFFISEATVANDLVIAADTAAVLCEIFICGDK